MLPSKGYLSNIVCPHLSGECVRPYCHFKHNIEEQDLIVEEKGEEMIKQVVKETVKKVLECRQIQDKVGAIHLETEKLISSVLRDMENTKVLEKNQVDMPSYNPTPISELSRRHIPVILAPSKPTYLRVPKGKKVNQQNPLFKQIFSRPIAEPHCTNQTMRSPVCVNFENSEDPYTKISKGYSSDELQCEKVHSSQNSNTSGMKKFVQKSSVRIEDDSVIHSEILKKIEKPTAIEDDEDVEINEVKNETIVVSSSSSNSPNLIVNEDEEDSSPECLGSPPLKKKKVLDTNQEDLSSPVPELLSARWQRAREIITSKNNVNGKMKIAPVANVQLLLTVKDSFLNRPTKTGKQNRQKMPTEKQSCTTISTDMNTLKSLEDATQPIGTSIIKGIGKKSHISVNTVKYQRKKVNQQNTGASQIISRPTMEPHNSNQTMKPSVCAILENPQEQSKKIRKGYSTDELQCEKVNSSQNSNDSGIKNCIEKSLVRFEDDSVIHSEILKKIEKSTAIEDDEDVEINEDENDLVTNETIVISSSSSNSPNLTVNEDEETSSRGSLDSPPPKRKRIVDTDPVVLPPPVPEPYAVRWQKARDIISSRNNVNGNMKIAPVANVQLLLTAEDSFLNRPKPTGKQNSRTRPTKNDHNATDDSSQPIETPVIKGIVRKSHISVNAIKYPTILMEGNLKIQFSIRQQALNKLFDEFCKYVSQEIAEERAQQMEIQICRRLHVTKTYKNAIAVAVLRIRKQKGVIFDGEAPKELLRSDSLPSFTNGWSLYQCFSEYLLTEDEYRSNGFPIEWEHRKGCAYIEASARRTKVQRSSISFQQTCDHCSQTYTVDKSGFPVKEFDCFYHWGKLRRVRVFGGFVEKFTCCGGDMDGEPCTNGRYHVCDLFDDNLLEGFRTTRPMKPGSNPNKAAIYGLDCEMCYTTRGIELTRCTLVDLNGRTIYDKIVVPDYPITDYCTRFSGITEDLISSSTLKLKNIQMDLLNIINDKTILVGHSLENDLKVLRIFHRTLVDTSVVFPHKNGLPFKLSLKKISKDLLNLTIQENEGGHDSYEDANACVQIMLWKIKEDAKKRKPRVIIGLESKKKVGRLCHKV